MQKLDICQFPLSGTRLIEASAGTGKTYTIAGLYLRLIIEEKLHVEQILVVTFTQAATEELRDRIRQRLFEAKKVFTKGVSDDVLLNHLLNTVKSREKTIFILDEALTYLDEMAVFTIHGFCQRMLQEHAFESQAFFENDFLSDEQALKQEVIEDFWRCTVYPASANLVTMIQQKWKNPQALLATITPFLSKIDLHITPHISFASAHECEQAFSQHYQNMQHLWSQQQDELRVLIGQTKYPKNHLNSRILKLENFLRKEQLIVPSPIKYFSSILIAKNSKTKLIKHEFFDTCTQLLKCSQQLSKLIIKDAIHYCEQQMSHRKKDQAQISFDDLLCQIKAALSSATGSKLAHSIRKRYPFAMIDEFQDTDPLQYQIFNQIYYQQKKCGLFMIGDPKQAIYSFRGADIFTYMQARQQLDGHRDHFTLSVNWRSNSSMINAINHLFQFQPNAFIYDQIEFFPVDSSMKADDNLLLIDGQQPSALHFWFLQRDESNVSKKTIHDPYAKKPPSQDVIKKVWAEQTVAQQVAHEIHYLLNHQSAFIGDQPLMADNIAILVSNRFQAAIIQKALRKYQLGSVFYSRDSVFNTDVAVDFYYVLNAIAYPKNDALLKAGLATDLMGLSMIQIDSLSHDPQATEHWLNQMEAYQLSWQKNNFMTMFRQLLHQQGIASRLLSQVNGERRLTNLLHLAEILQSASESLFGIPAVLDWFIDQQVSGHQDQNQQLRLESDHSLVKIVTIHKSKGLEYDIVFVPFSYAGPKPKKQAPFLFHAPELTLELGSKEQQKHASSATKEALAEQLRLLYVAVTRAKHRCYLCWGQVSNAQYSALAYLFFRPEYGQQDVSRTPSIMGAMSDDVLVNQLSDFIQCNEAGSTHISLSNITVFDSEDVGIDATLTNTALTCPKFNQNVSQNWRLTSFSSLVNAQHDWQELPDYDALSDYDLNYSDPQESLFDHPYSSIFQFPKGSRAGTFMHTLFEETDFSHTDEQALSHLVSEQLIRYGFDAVWHKVVCNMVNHVLDTPLDERIDLKLRHIHNHKRLVEMEFHLPLKPLQAHTLNQIIAQFDPIVEPDVHRHDLVFAQVEGMLKGFIDLIFEYKGKFYIVDYKSNHLGYEQADYHAKNLQQAIYDHRYDVQYLLYSIALHRYLKQRLNDYQYEQHFGGIYYLFLRGMSADNTAENNDYGIYQHKPDYQQIVQLDALFGSTLNDGAIQ